METKFRGKNFKGGWEIGSLLKIGKRRFIVPTDTKIVLIFRLEHIHWDDMIEVLPETVGQFIGEQDKNGTDIYGNDICKFIIMSGQEETNPLNALTVVISFENGCWGFKHTHPEEVCEEDRGWRSFWISNDEEMWDSNYFEIIGNTTDKLSEEINVNKT